MAYVFVRNQNLDISGSVYDDTHGTTLNYTYRFALTEKYEESSKKTRLYLDSAQVKVNLNDRSNMWGTMKWNGTVITWFVGESVETSYNSFTTYWTYSDKYIEIQHDANGNASPVSVSFEQSSGQPVWIGSNYGFAPTGTSYVVVGFPTSTTRQIPIMSHGASASTIGSCTNPATTKSNLTLTVNRSSSSYYHKATFSIGGTTLATSAAFASSLTYAVPRTWFNSYPNDDSLDVTVSVQTYTSSACTTPVGSPTTTTITVKADADMKPSAASGWATASVYNTGTAAAGTNKYIKGFSKAAISFSSAKETLMNGATVASRTIQCLGTTVRASPYRTPVLTSTSVQVICTLTDTRGRTATQTLTITVNDYAKPKLSGISAFRCNAQGTADEDGLYFRVQATRTYSSIGGSVTCTLNCAVAQSGGSYGSEISLTSGTAQTIGNGTYSVDRSYTIRFKAADSLGGTAFYYVTIPSRKWAMKFRPDGEGVAFGKSAETDKALELPADWTIRVGNAIVSGYTPGTYTLSNVPVFGWITTDRTDLVLFVPLPRSTLLCSGVTVSALRAALRLVSGGFVKGNGYDFSSVIYSSALRGGGLYVQIHDGGGLGVTNNTPVAGLVNSISFTLT